MNEDTYLNCININISNNHRNVTIIVLPVNVHRKPASQNLILGEVNSLKKIEYLTLELTRIEDSGCYPRMMLNIKELS